MHLFKQKYEKVPTSRCSRLLSFYSANQKSVQQSPALLISILAI